MEIETEICVIGGGPAGSAAALRLAQLGRRVCLIERQTFPRQHVGESLPPSIWPILNLLGVDETVSQAGFLRASGSLLHWAGAFERRGVAGDHPGLLVDRGQFDAVLLRAAQAAGAQVVQPARAYRPVRQQSGWEIPVRTDTGAFRIQAQILLDAAGRQAGLGRRFLPASQPLLALYAYWHVPPGFGPQARVEAGQGHWYWGALLPGGVVNAMVFVDPDACIGLPPADRRDLYLNLLARSTLLAPCLEQRRIGPVRRADATSQAETTPPTRDLLRVGEASFAVDALSSQGVQLAMGQAVQAAAVVNTLLTTPEHSDLALSFYADRQFERVQTHAALAADFYARQHAVDPSHFWAERAKPLDWVKSPAFDPNREALRDDQPLILSPQAKLIASGVQTASHIEPGLVIGHPNLPRPVANLEGAMLGPLLERLGAPTTTLNIIKSWSEVLATHTASRILRWLWYHRIVIPAADQA
ncbi:tryptophan 7-halogenase [Ruegeria sp. SCSIO 43209]|uniref:flavin-dependent monooxygenase QhpG n=1 Tax=Ruegeria sp. SCSIO 43209 TaxID=2793010 RepID=UPI001CA9E583|nr:FAD-dependent oxidoreductase [Ruegeria sp. SCSIO 43209]UAB87928.1 tryptophan 7-halogenase [Ruegeria sp. SCSIO 43209]